MSPQVVDGSAAATQVRDEVRSWLEENHDEERPLREWRQMLLDTGWGMPTFPEEWYGRGCSGELARVVAQEFSRVRAPGLAGGMARSLASPTIVEHGDDEQRRRLIPPALLGDETWCQLFSEPGAGSDLASVTTTAALHGDEFIINGQQGVDVGRDLVARKAGQPGPEGSTLKVLRNHIGRLQRNLAPSLLGPAAMLVGDDAPYEGAIPMQALSSCGPMIFAGTDEIQHNIIGERILGLPREPAVDIDVPFREVKTSGRRPS